MTLRDASDAMGAGRLTAAALVEDSLAAIAAHQARINAFTLVHGSGARAEAAELDAERRADRVRGLLHGIPISLKDLIDVRGVVTSAGSRVLFDRVAPGDAVVATRLREAGAIVIGRTNLHEFALGTTSEDSAFGPVRHPADPARSPGGSSGGAAAAVAVGAGLAAIGTDTGGSVRIPAAICGLVGLKPAKEDVSTDGVIPLSPSFDHVGPLTRSVDDAAALWAVLAGVDVRRPRPIPLGRLRLARLGPPYETVVAPEVASAYGAALDRLARAGATLTSRRLETAVPVMDTYVAIVLSEAARYHARWLDERGEAYTPTVRSRLESGRTIPAIRYLDALAEVRALERLVDNLFVGSDALVLPTLPLVAPHLGASDIALDPASAERTTVRAAMLRNTQLFNMSGHPAVSLPVETSGLPIGLQLVGPRHDTARLLDIAAACEPVVRGS
jgi:aspartyl-tRNA(Asn)/glutamyl-tRNA(Gln) amidotransferase subunit A